MKHYEVVIIGCGPAGIGAAVALHDAGINAPIIEKGAPGGKVNICPRVDNYPGFTKIPGANLAVELYKRALSRNIELISTEITSLTKQGDLFHLQTLDEEITAKYVIVATGTVERKIGLAKETEMLGHGLSYCATCDGHFYKGKRIVVVGGGNAALKEAIYLTNIASEVTLVHRRNQFRGNEKLVEEFKEIPNTKILTPYVPVEIIGEDHITGIKLQNRETGEYLTLETEGFFPLVGQDPSTTFVDIEGVRDEFNTIAADSKTRESKCPNLFACGDVVANRPVRQIYLSEFDGKTAAKEIIRRIKGE